jgi:hypothetical protein
MACPSLYSAVIHDCDVGLHRNPRALSFAEAIPTIHIHNGEEQMSSTIPSTEELVRDALSPMMNLPDDYRNLLLKNEIPNQQDWDEANSRIVNAAATSGCVQLVQSMLDPFWQGNKSFGTMLDTITAICPFNP